MKSQNTWAVITIAALLTACGSGSNPAPVIADNPITEESNPFEVVETEAATEPEIAVIAQPEIEVVEAMPEPAIEVAVPDPVAELEAEREPVVGEDPVYSPDPIETVRVPVETPVPFPETRDLNEPRGFDTGFMVDVLGVSTFSTKRSQITIQITNNTESDVMNVRCAVFAYDFDGMLTNNAANASMLPVIADGGVNLHAGDIGQFTMDFSDFIPFGFDFYAVQPICAYEYFDGGVFSSDSQSLVFFLGSD